MVRSDQDRCSNVLSKVAGADAILAFFIERLRIVFPHVVEKPLILYNSNKSPMYALCFAAAKDGLSSAQ